MQLQDLLIQVADILEKLGVPYCITGGYAVSVWGAPRGTFDIDIIVQLGVSSINPLAKELRTLSEAGYIEEAIAREAVTKGKEFNYFHPETGIKVDFWAIRAGDAMGALELKRRVSRKLDGHAIYFISPEDLILSKLRWYKESISQKQRDDITSVLRIQKKLDMQYLESRAAAQHTLDIFEELLADAHL